MDMVDCVIQLKTVRYRSGRRKDFAPRPIHELLLEVFDKTTTARERHDPQIPNAESHEWHCFTHRIENSAPEVLFEYCTYRPGAVPLQMTPELAGANVELSANPIVDEDGQPLELVQTAQVLALGDVLLVQSVRGKGGLGLIGRYLTQMCRRYIDSAHPSVVLMDAATSKLQEAIRRGGGVVAVRAALMHPVKDETPRFGKLLSTGRSKIRRTDAFKVEWKNSSGLDEEDVLAALDEGQSDAGIERVVLELKNGEIINGFDRYRIRKSVPVADIGQRNPSREELRAEMLT